MIVTCNFCGKTVNEVTKMIVGNKPSVGICNECVLTCVEILLFELKKYQTIIEFKEKP